MGQIIDNREKIVTAWESIAKEASQKTDRDNADFTRTIQFTLGGGLLFNTMLLARLDTLDLTNQASMILGAFCISAVYIAHLKNSTKVAFNEAVGKHSQSQIKHTIENYKKKKLVLPTYEEAEAHVRDNKLSQNGLIRGIFHLRSAMIAGGIASMVAVSGGDDVNPQAQTPRNPEDDEYCLILSEDSSKVEEPPQNSKLCFRFVP